MLRANVGDKYVLEEMLKTGATLAGAVGTHYFSRWRGDDWRRSADRAAGDGCDRAFAEDAGELVSDLKVFPQKIQNVRVRRRFRLRRCGGATGIEDAERELDGNGRVWCVIRELRLWRGDGGKRNGREDAALTAGLRGDSEGAGGLKTQGLRLRMNFSRVLRSNAPTATLLVR